MLTTQDRKSMKAQGKGTQQVVFGDKTRFHTAPHGLSGWELESVGIVEFLSSKVLGFVLVTVKCHQVVY